MPPCFCRALGFRGSASIVVWVSVTSVVMFAALKVTKRLRVHSKADEIGIGLYEHGASLWPDVLPVDDEPEAMGSPGAVTAPAMGD